MLFAISLNLALHVMMSVKGETETGCVPGSKIEFFNDAGCTEKLDEIVMFGIKMKDTAMFPEDLTKKCSVVDTMK